MCIMSSSVPTQISCTEALQQTNVTVQNKLVRKTCEGGYAAHHHGTEYLGANRRGVRSHAINVGGHDRDMGSEIERRMQRTQDVVQIRIALQCSTLGMLLAEDQSDKMRPRNRGSDDSALKNAIPTKTWLIPGPGDFTFKSLAKQIRKYCKQGGDDGRAPLSMAVSLEDMVMLSAALRSSPPHLQYFLIVPVEHFCRECHVKRDGHAADLDIGCFAVYVSRADLGCGRALEPPDMLFVGRRESVASHVVLLRSTRLQSGPALYVYDSSPPAVFMFGDHRPLLTFNPKVVLHIYGTPPSGLMTLSLIALAKAFVLPTTTFRSAKTRSHLDSTGSTTPTMMEHGGNPSVARIDFLRKAGVALATTAVSIGALPRQSHAALFSDETLGFQFETPEGWERSEAELSGRRKIVIYASSQNPGANAFVAYSPVRGDFTSLGSFGTLEEVSKTVLPEGEGVTSTLVDAYTKNKSYVYDYIVTQQGRPSKHIKTLWLLFPEDGQLATITAQCNEEDYGKLGKAVDSVIGSIKKI